MIVLDALAILLAIGLGVDFYRSKESFKIWLFEASGFFGYLLKSLIIVHILATLIWRADFSFLMYKIF